MQAPITRVANAISFIGIVHQHWTLGFPTRTFEERFFRLTGN